MAKCGIASRRHAEEYIRAGRVHINGMIVKDLACQVGDDDIVELDGHVISYQPEKVYIMMNKPAGVVTTCNDQFGRQSIMDIIGDIGLRVFPVGRLDYNTEGLLFLTNDGDFAKKFTHPSNQIPKTYIAQLDKEITRQQLEKLCKGVDIHVTDNKSPIVKTLPAKAEFLDKAYKPAPHFNHSAFISLTITEGRNRQVRKMFETLGCRIVKLKRTAVGNLTLGSLKSGQWKQIKPNLVR